MGGDVVLVVEDNGELRHCWQAILELMGHEVHAVASAEAALAATAVLDRMQLLLTDYDLLGMHGLELVRAVRLRRPDLPVLMITASRDRAIADCLGHDPAAVLLHKPADLGDIEAVVDRLLRNQTLREGMSG